MSIDFGVKVLTQHHTADNICKDIQEMIDAWKISTERIVSITTDNGANIVLAVKKLLSNDKHIICFAHNLNLCAMKALGNETVKPLVAVIDK